MDTVLTKITIHGIVQGVGFRPFVFNLAERLALHGWVLNNSAGVEIEAEGNRDDVTAFLAALRTEAPPLAYIESLEVRESSPQGHQKFEIRHSEHLEGHYALVSPDVATCPDCLRELLDPADRRHRYPFTNCTNCGPRFTIIADMPYDRPSTTMRAFSMCPDCQREYEDPRNRRFHAQPNACPVCGPQVELVWTTDNGQRRTKRAQTDDESRNTEHETRADRRPDTQHATDTLARAADMLRSGKILAIKGLGGFHLACDATNAQAVRTLRERKRRPDKPFAIMIATIDQVKEHCIVSVEEETLLASPQCPIVLLPWRTSSEVAREVAPANRYLGVMLPYTPLHHVLLRDVARPLVMTSGNLTEEPIAAENDEALARLGHLADAFLLHNRDIYARYDDSVWFVPHTLSKYCHCEESPGEEAIPGMLCSEPALSTAEGVAQNDRIAQPIRRARGYAPFPIKLPFQAGQILACGPELKNTFCLTRDNFAFLSQHIGDMENLDTFQHYQRTVELYKHLFRIEPEIVAYDLHPDYLATKYAREQIGRRETTDDGRRTKGVAAQHHHAHLAACLVDNDWSIEDGPVIGVTLDGTGLGTDGNIWGGEWLVGDYRGYQRAAHLEYLPLPGGDTATRTPWRTAYSYLHTLVGDVPDWAVPADVSDAEVHLLRQQLKRGLNCPLTSSMGRLFDSVSAMLGVCARASYEAQAAIELEMVGTGDVGSRELANWGFLSVDRTYPFLIEAQDKGFVIRVGETLAAVTTDREANVPTSQIALHFHQTVAQMTVEVCERIAGETELHTIALSGGCFQNRLLLALTVPALRQADFQVLLHRQVPCNDGGLSLGQAAIAHFQEA